MNQLPTEWRQWVTENLGRGAPVHVVIEALTQKGFAPALAAAEVSRLCVVGSPYEYEGDGYPNANAVVVEGRTIRVVMAIEKPRIAVFEGVLSEDECNALIELARPKLARSSTVNDESGGADYHDLRSSSGMSFAVNETPFVAELDRRIAALMRLPVANGEGIQIMRYEIGGEYKPHFDFFAPHLLANDSELARGGQRVASLIVYLNSVDEGGATIFPEIGLRVVPKPGNAVLFTYSNSRDQLDPMTLHGGAPVTKGEKWIATKWMRRREYR